MDAHPFLNFSFGELHHLGSFDIAESLVDMEFSNQAIRQDEDETNSEYESEINQQRPLLGNLLGEVLDRTANIKEKNKRLKFRKG